MIKNNFVKKIFKFIVLIFSLLVAMQLIACEDDAILEPQPSDDCTGSYCNLSLPRYDNYAQIKNDNPSIF